MSKINFEISIDANIHIKNELKFLILNLNVS